MIMYFCLDSLWNIVRAHRDTLDDTKKLTWKEFAAADNSIKQYAGLTLTIGKQQYKVGMWSIDRSSGVLRLCAWPKESADIRQFGTETYFFEWDMPHVSGTDAKLLRQMF